VRPGDVRYRLRSNSLLRCDYGQIVCLGAITACGDYIVYEPTYLAMGVRDKIIQVQDRSSQ
jgi:hypothetical protein